MNNTESVEAEIQVVQRLASDIRTFNYVVAASATFLVYDVLITYSEEVCLDICTNPCFVVVINSHTFR